MAKYDNITVRLLGQDGSSFSIIGICRREMKRAKCSQDDIDMFIDEAMSGDYNDLLNTCADYFNVE